MGLEATCTAMFGGQRSKGNARLENDVLRFDGKTFQIRWTIRDMGAIRLSGSTVVIEHPQGALRLELGDKAAKWVERLKSPRSRLDRLGIARGERILLAGFDDPSFRAELAEREVDLARSPLRADNDTIVGAVRRPEELARLTTWKTRMQKNGKMWVLWPRAGGDLKEDDVRARALDLGLVDVLVARFSDEWSALKLVVRKANRDGAGPTVAKVSKAAPKAASSAASKTELKAGPEAAPKTATKAASKPAVKAVAKAGPRSAPKPAAGPAAKSATGSVAKPAVRAAAKPASAKKTADRRAG